ncbi:TetR/AcrR family transcriptional regulator [Paenibacillus sp. J5C_2022]|uniref:TetR/AcrR family transcriptional regulator n=1 Tax=Paenibacillus sp. J5C2022 TaxID=2977129 RepID=UPI0021CEC91E|nr:TetR/AcrR family transcriptional regulator [Paenibacillus sp. J5C2022]MCU6707474.1 TetR/AcrR family transcriptional regulator [Paenibacillus sp. J5C2022]
MPTQTDRRIVRTKSALKEALVELMTDKPFRSITITEICRQANYNRGTFYAHYQHKDDLLEEIMNDTIQGFMSAFRKPYENKDQLQVDLLTHHTIKIFHYVEANRPIFSLLLDRESNTGFQERLCQSIQHMLLHEFQFHFPEEQKEIDMNLYVYHHSYALIGILMYWVTGGFRYSSGYMAEQLLYIVNSDRQNLVSIKIERRS